MAPQGRNDQKAARATELLYKYLEGTDIDPGPRSFEITNGKVWSADWFWTYTEGRRLLNMIVVRTGMVYSDWQHEIICTLPKVEGSTALEDIRPIGLVPLLRNILMGIQNLIVLKVWERSLELLSRECQLEDDGSMLPRKRR